MKQTMHVLVAMAAALSANASVLEPGNVEVVLAKGSATPVAFAAEEATNFLSRVLGAPVPIVAEPGGGGKTSIVLGESPWAKEAGVSVEGRPRDTFVVKAAGDRIYIVGRDTPGKDLRKLAGMGYAYLIGVERATLFGVYDFLERHAGCRFYFPDELGIIAPRRGRIEVPDGERAVTPALLLRNVYMHGDGRWFCEKDKADRARVKSMEWLRLRLASISIPCCHGSHDFKYIERFGKTRPDFMALKDNGTRCLDPKVFAPHQYCWSNPDLQETLYQDVKAYLTGQPASSRGLSGWGPNCRDGKYVDIMPEDSFLGCHCERCAKAYTRRGEEANYATELIWGVTAKIGRRLIEEGIPGFVTQMVYRPYGRMPDFDLPPNVRVMIAKTGPWSVARPGAVEAEVADFKAWTEKIGHPVWIWTYPHKWGPTRIDGLASMGPRAWGRYYKAAAPWIFGTFAECETENAFGNHLNYYVFSRVCWDAETDVDAVVDEYHRLMFGAGAGEMKSFFDTLETNWVCRITGRIAETELGPLASPPSPREIWTKIYSPEERGRLRGLLAAAKAKVPADSPEARRMDLMKRELFDGLDVTAKAWEKRAATVGADVYDADSGVPLRVCRVQTNAREFVSPSVKTDVSISRADGFLSIVWDCEEPDMEGTLCPDRPDDHPMNWSYNGVECKMNPSGDGRTYYQFILTEKGVLTDTRLIRDGARAKPDMEWSSGAKRHVEKTDTGWRARLDIPIASLPWIRESFTANFCRNRVRRAGSEFSYSSRHAVGYGDYDGFGTVVVRQR